MKIANNIIITVVMTLLMMECKKYPENTLWFTPPYRALYQVLEDAGIALYEVNGIDSTYQYQFSGMIIEGLGGMGAPLLVMGGVPIVLSCPYFHEFLLKDIKLKNNYTTVVFCKEWKILKLTNKELFIERWENNNHYKIKLKRRQYK
ncbi:MAG: hypothetical protein Fur0023_13600 [Bacteroidia bacterium]